MSSEPSQQPIAVTGMALITPLGDEPLAFEQALVAGKSSIEPGPDDAYGWSRLVDFEASRYATTRGMRVYGRATQLGICSAKMALADAGGTQDGGAADELGVVMGSTYGHLDTLLEYDRGLASVGPQLTNPALMPVALLSSPGAATGLALAARGACITLSNAGASGLDVIGLATLLLNQGRLRMCVVTASHSPSETLARAAAKAGVSSKAADYRVFDRNRRGIAVGEGTGALVLERLDDARAAGRQPKALIHGHASAFAVAPSGARGALARACRGALKQANTEVNALTLVSSSANGSPHDGDEASALLDVLGSHAGTPPLIAIKAQLGDCADASGILQSVAAIRALASGSAPPIPRLESPEIQGLRYVTSPTRVQPGQALITAMSLTGSASALVLSSPHG